MIVKELKISETHLDQIEHLLAHSMNGIHLLFDNRTIARILKSPTKDAELFQVRNMDKIHDLFTVFVGHKTLQEKRMWLDSLDKKSYEMLLRTYFYIVENSLMNADPTRH